VSGQVAVGIYVAGVAICLAVLGRLTMKHAGRFEAGTHYGVALSEIGVRFVIAFALTLFSLSWPISLLILLALLPEQRR
jgi:hypothetical protein